MAPASQGWRKDSVTQLSTKIYLTLRFKIKSSKSSKKIRVKKGLGAQTIS